MYPICYSVVMAHRGALVSLSIALVLWSLTFPLVRAMLGEVPIEALLALRFTAAAVLLFAWWAVKGKTLPRGRDFWLTAGSGFCCVTAYQLLSTHGIRTVASGPASVLVDTMPIFATVFSVFLLNHRANWRTWTGLGIAFAGAAIIALGESQGKLQLNFGVGLLLLAALIFGIGTVAQKPVMKRYDSLGVTAVSFAAGALAMLCFSPNLLAISRQIPTRHIFTIAFLAVGPGALAYALWGHALSKLPVSKASASLLLIGPLTFLIAWLFFGEIPATASMIGAAFACGGVLLVHSDQTA
ncbi:DMT family transporter [Bryobacter aggregatus]|uniref:DMT family transporter n=1 Tax=Bryobacter aggregatus TaxID=360054 RepID=UPI0004E0C3FD|nr:DMT family transporter [Bryobacter aggregatus]